MKYRNILIALILALLPVRHASAAGLFGIELGEKISTYDYEKAPVDDLGALKVYELKPPHPDARFDTYAVDTWNGAVIRIMASSPDDLSPEAKTSLEVCRQLRSELSQRFGTPDLRNDDLDDAGADLRDYLVDEGGIEVLEWDFTGKKETGLGAAYVFLAGAQDEKEGGMSYCTLYLESPEYAGLNETARRSTLEGGELPDAAPGFEGLPEPRS